jgi:hypothetical protein
MCNLERKPEERRWVMAAVQPRPMRSDGVASVYVE